MLSLSSFSVETLFIPFNPPPPKALTPPPLVYDLGIQTTALSMIPRILALEPGSNARLMAVFILCDVAGSVAGVAIMPKIYLLYGYRISGAVSFGFVGLMRKCTCFHTHWFSSVLSLMILLFGATF